MSHKFKSLQQLCSTGGTLLLVIIVVSCKGQGFGVLQPTPKDLCKCLPIEPDISDYRHLAKHVAIANIAPQEVTVEMVLSWSQDLFIPPDTPRTGRELEVFHIANAFLQNISVNAADCDVVMEISHTADKNASRVIVETPIEYCGARQNIQAQLKQRGFRLDSQHGGELPQALPVDVVGMAFEDFEHDRGTGHVGTLWELHPAIVTLQP